MRRRLSIAKTIESLFATYEKVSQQTFEYLASITPRPAEMKPEAYERTLRARAFDISALSVAARDQHFAREIVNARTLENQIAHLLSQPHKEVRDLGTLLKQAAISPAYNANEESLCALVAEIRAVSPEIAERAERELLREVRVAPTLVKYGRSESLRSRDAPRTPAGRRRTDARRLYRTRATGRSG